MSEGSRDIPYQLPVSRGRVVDYVLLAWRIERYQQIGNVTSLLIIWKIINYIKQHRVLWGAVCFTCTRHWFSRLAVVFHSPSGVRFFATPWTAASQASLSIPALPELKLMSLESVMPSSHLILCCPLLLLPSIFPSIWIFSNESALPIRWPKYWSFSVNILSPSNEHPWL